MDFEKLNVSYKMAKEKLESTQVNVKQWEKEIEAIQAAIKMLEGTKDLLKMSNLNAKILDPNVSNADIEHELKNQKKELKVLQKKLQEAKKEVEVFKEIMNEAIEQITADPEVQKHFQQVLGERYSRKIKKIGKEKETVEKTKKENEKKKQEEEKKLEKVDAVEKIVKEHPSMKNRLQGMLNANNIIRRNDKKLANLDPIKDKSEIEKLEKQSKQANIRLNTNRKELLDYAKRKKINITKETLDDIMKNSVYDKQAKQVDVNQTLSSTKEKSKKQIEVYEKEISKADKKLSKYEKTVLTNKKAISKLEHYTPRDREKEKQEKLAKRNKAQGQEQEEQEGQQGSKDNKEEKLKWWQFRKRFIRWRESKNIDSLPEPEEEETKFKEFAKNLKYDVVQDASRRVQKEMAKEAQKEIKETVENEEEIEK